VVDNGEECIFCAKRPSLSPAPERDSHLLWCVLESLLCLCAFHKHCMSETLVASVQDALPEG
jgi:hypothetical protein